MERFPRNFSHIGVLEFELEQGKGKNKIIHQMILVYNTNYLTDEEAFQLFRENEYSDYMFAMPKATFDGIFRNAGFGGSLSGIVS